ncbi:MAG: hypothetical protein HY721_34530 [Planctomycetes bacterium]|nr:hypothetical protein [Planctomycetota bacterium]
MRRGDLSRREALRRIAASAAAGAAPAIALGAAKESPFQLATFQADVTPPLGHPLMGGGIAPASSIEDPLSARGIALLGDGEPIVLAAVDWCEIRNDAYDRWRDALASAALTRRERVLLASVHQHDAPVADLEAERMLEERKAAGRICDLAFHEKAVERAAAALREGLRATRRVTHVGTGMAKVERIASNRRFVGPDGRVSFGRTSSTRDPAAHAAPEGTVDPWLRTLSFWDGERPLAALSAYATHPMSYYGKGGVSSDFVGLARSMREAEEPGVFQAYFSGASGNVTAGKHNDGAPENRRALAERLAAALRAASKATERRPLERASFRSVPLRLEPRSGPGFTAEDLERRLATDPRPFGQCLAALGLSWRKRCAAGRAIDLVAVDLGGAQVVLLPGESYVEHQLLAQKLRPGSFVLTIGYGECATGYVPIEKAFEEGDTNLADWCWVAPGAERALREALEAALREG